MLFVCYWLLLLVVIVCYLCWLLSVVVIAVVVVVRGLDHYQYCHDGYCCDWCLLLLLVVFVAIDCHCCLYDGGYHRVPVLVLVYWALQLLS